MIPSKEFAPWAIYLGWLLGCTTALVVFVGLLNFTIDALAIYGTPRIPGVSAAKPYLDHHRELARHLRARRICAEVGIFGNSRAEIGLDPEGEAFSRRGLSAFNHAIPGSGVLTAYQQIIWLEASGCMPNTTILGVEFFDFIGGDDRVKLPTLYSSPPPGVSAQIAAETLFSLTALGDSIKTIGVQRAAYPSLITDRGFNPLLNYTALVKSSGHYPLFAQRAGENVRNWSKKAARLEAADGGASADAEVLTAFLERASGPNRRAVLVIYPYHVQIRVIINLLGLGEQFAAWKQRLVEIASTKPNVEVWDFSGLAPETSEAIPVRGDTATMLRYYWEAGHFKKELGEKMLERIFGHRDGFGTVLNHETLGAVVAADQVAVQQFIGAASPLVEDVRRIVALQRAKQH